MNTVDNRGLACPQPVIRTKKALDDIESGSIVSIIDNEVAKKNVARLAIKMGCHISEELKDGDFYLTISKQEGESELDQFVVTTCDSGQPGNTVVFCSSDQFGTGSAELSRVLLQGFFYALTELPAPPEAIILMNSGINLSTDGSHVLDSLKKLEEQGTQILSCGTCLDYYNKKDQLAVGEITNMYTAVEILNSAARIIKP